MSLANTISTQRPLEKVAVYTGGNDISLALPYIAWSHISKLNLIVLDT